MPETVQNIVEALGPGFFVLAIGLVAFWMISFPILVFAITLRRVRHREWFPSANFAELLQGVATIAQGIALSLPEATPANPPVLDAKIEAGQAPGTAPPVLVQPATTGSDATHTEPQSYDDFDRSQYSAEEVILYDDWDQAEAGIAVSSRKSTAVPGPEISTRTVAGIIEGSGYSLEEEVLYDDWEDAELDAAQARAESSGTAVAATPGAEAPREEGERKEGERKEGERKEAARAETPAGAPSVPPAPSRLQPIAAIEESSGEMFDPYPDVRLPDDEEDVSAEPIGLVHEIDRSPDAHFHDHQFQYFLDQFRHNLADWTHDRTRAAFAYLPGPDDNLERNVMPQLFWKPAALCEERRYRMADHIMPELYFHALRKTAFMPVVDADDRTVYIHILNYALWRDRSDWILNLAAFFDEHRIPGDDLFLLAACLARGAGKENLAGYYFNRADEKNGPLLAVYHLQKGDHQTLREMIKTSGPGAEDFAWLAWLYAGFTGDHRGERKVFARLLEKGDVVSIMDLYGALLMRGRLFVAARLLLRHPLLGRHSDAGLRAILQLYFRNGKYLLYLTRLEKSPRWPGRQTWFEVYFCLHRLGGARDAQGAFDRLIQGKDYADLPPIEERREFQEEMTDPRLRASRLEIQEIDYHHDIVNLAALLAETEKIPVFRRTSREAEQERIRKVYAVIQYILEEDLAVDRLELYVRAMSGALLLRPSRLPERLFQRLRALSGRNFAARMLVGLLYFERGRYHEAIDYLEICQMRHPLIWHRMAEMLVSEKRLWEAEEAYRQIVRFYPDEPIFWYNLGVILEKNGRPRGSRQALETALGLNPHFKAASDRLARLKLAQPVIF